MSFINITGFENYSIHEDGRVKNNKSGRILKLADNKGYKRVQVARGIYKYVHILVATAHIPNPLELPEVNHIDEVKHHNWKDNLEWCTHKSNIQHSIHKWCKTYKFLSPSDEIVIVVNVKRFAIDNNLSQSGMSAVALGKRKQHKGWRVYG